MKKGNIEEKIVFLTNTLGCFILGAYFASSGEFIDLIITVYLVINFFCFVSLIGLYKKKI